MISPNLFANILGEGYTSIDNFGVTINWKQNIINSLWSRSDSQPAFLTNTINIIPNPAIHLRFISPGEIEVYDIPRFPVYPYHLLTTYPTDLPPVLPGMTDTSQNSNIQIPSIPRRIVIAIISQVNFESYQQATNFGPIQQISVTFGSKTGILSSASQRDLYQIAIKNGVQMSWPEWAGLSMPNYNGVVRNFTGIGSVLPLLIPEDIAVNNPETTTSGVLESTNIQVSVTWTNVHPTQTMQPRLMVIVDQEGIFGINDSTTFLQTGMITREQVLNAGKQHSISYHNTLDAYGGANDFFGDIGKWFKKLPDHLKNALNFTEENILPIVKKVLPLILGAGLEDVGPGEGGLVIGGDDYDRYGNPVGMGRKKKRGKKSIKGGAQNHSSEIRKNLEKMIEKPYY